MSNAETKFLERASDGVRTALGIGGLITAILGVLILIFPGLTALAGAVVLAVLLSAYALINGVVYVGSAIFSRTMKGWGRVGYILLGVLFIVGGVIMMANIQETAGIAVAFITFTIGFLWIFEGVMAFVSLGETESRGWAIFYGIVSVLAGFTILFSPLISATFLWLFLGVSMVVMGIIQVVRAFQVHKAVNEAKSEAAEASAS